MMRSGVLLFLMGVMASGCGGRTADTVAPGSTSSPAGSSTSAVLTWHKDIRAIVETKCANCHVPNALAPFPLLSYSDAVAYKAQMARAVEKRTMPPWPPNASCQTYQHDRSLSDDEREKFLAWAKGDGAEGDPATYTPPVREPLPTIREDKILPMPEPYTPQQGPDDHRCFLLDWSVPEATYITGFSYQAGNEAIAHHAIAYNVPESALDAVKKLDAEDPGPGYHCPGGPGVTNSQWVGAWAPGTGANVYPKGMGIQIEKGSRVILQMHYNTANAVAGPDRSEVRLELAPTVEIPGRVIPFADPSWIANHTMNIKAGDPDAVHRYTMDLGFFLPLLSNGTLPALKPFRIHNVALHMHTRGTQAALRIQRKDGTTDCALQIDDWNFHWQGNYQLKESLVVNPGDKMDLECHFDNSGKKQPYVDGKPAPVTDTNWGDGSGDEMCLGIFFASP